MVSVKKLTTVSTSNSSLLRTSPECRFSFPFHSERRSRSTICCCILFWALMPRIFLIHILEILRPKSRSTRTAIQPTALRTFPLMVPEATSIACFTAVTWARLTTTPSSPTVALRIACNRLPLHALQSHRRIARVSYSVLGSLRSNFNPMPYLHNSRPANLFSQPFIGPPHQFFT